MLHTALAAVAFVTQVGLGVMFLWSAAGKAWEWSVFQSMIGGLGLPPIVAGPAAGLLIAVEFSLGALLVVGQYPAMSAIGVLLLLVLFAIVGLYAEGRGLNLSCSCFGRARTKLGRTTVTRAVYLAFPPCFSGSHLGTGHRPGRPILGRRQRSCCCVLSYSSTYTVRRVGPGLRREYLVLAQLSRSGYEGSRTRSHAHAARSTCAAAI